MLLAIAGGPIELLRGPTLVYLFEDESGVTDRCLYDVLLGEVGLPGSIVVSFRAHRIVAAKRIAYFRPSSMGTPRNLVLNAGRGGSQILPRLLPQSPRQFDSG
jgi:hypothetical protein